MGGGYKPEGYASISVYVKADGAQGMIDFLKQTFDAVEMHRYDNADGTIIYVEVLIVGSVLMIADGQGEFPAFPVWLHVYVPDVDETYRRALAAGGVPVYEPEQNGELDRSGCVQDPAGNTWWIATQIG